MAIKIEIKNKGLVPGITKREVQELTRDTLKGIGGAWHATYLPIHFTTEGARRYNMQKRKTKRIFAGTVVKNKGAQSPLPLVKTGQLRAQATAPPTIVSTFRKATVKMPVGFINRYKPNGFAGGQLRYELTRVLPQEEKELAKLAEMFLRARFTKKKKNIQVSTFRKPAK